MPLHPGLVKAISSGDRKRIHDAEQAYVFRLLATPRGSDWLEIQNGLGAHYLLDVDPKRANAHVTELVERGLVERLDSGKFRVRPEVIDLCRAMLADDAEGKA